MVLEFKKELVKDELGRIIYKKYSKQGNEYFNLRIWLDGEPEELDKVETVHYRLHQTFPNHPTVDDRLSNFQLDLWAWGMFDIVATITYQDRMTEMKQFFLEWELPHDNGSNYIQMPTDYRHPEYPVV